MNLPAANTSTASSPTSRPTRRRTGLNEDIIRLISAKKNEPELMLEWRLKAYRHWLTMEEPTWANVHYPPIDYQDITTTRRPSRRTALEEPGRGRSGDLGTFDKLGISLAEQERLAGVAVDAVFD